MIILKDFVRDFLIFVAQICAKMCVRAVIRAYLRDEAIWNKILKHEHWDYPKEHAYQFWAQTVKTEELDIVKKPENQVHELTDSNGSRWMANAIKVKPRPGKLVLYVRSRRT